MMILMIGVFSPSVNAEAKDAQLTIEAVPFPDSSIRYGEWLPIKLTVHNPGPVRQGYIHFQTGQVTGGRDTVISLPAELAPNSTMEYWMTIPGARYTRVNNEFVWNEGELRSGAEESFAGQNFIETQFATDAKTVVGVFSGDANAYRFLSTLAAHGHDVRVHALAAESFPDDSSWYGQFDVLAFNHFAADQIGTNEVQSIREWVRQGGMLILSGGAGYAQTMSAFSELAPVQAEATIGLDDLSSLTSFAQQELRLERPFTVSSGSVHDGTVWLAEDGVPLFVQRQFGNGTVWYVAYDVAQEPVVSWNGNVQVWQHVLAGLPGDHRNSSTHDRGGYNLWEMERELEFFPQLAPPPLGVLALFFFLYVIVVAPLLYFLLKKWDKRGWAWAAIPGIAVLFSVVIYGMGAWERGQTLAQGLALIELNGDGGGWKKTATSVFVPAGGTYDVTVSGRRLSTFHERYDSGAIRERVGSPNEWLIRGTDGDRLRFSGVPYWSIRKLWIEDTTAQDYGTLQIDLQAEPDAIAGEITNDTRDTLHDVHLLYQSRYHAIGSLEPGETRPFSFPLIQAGGRSHWRNLPHMIFPDDERKRVLFSMAEQMQAQEQKSGQRAPLVAFGIGIGEGDPIQIDDRLVTPTESMIWWQEVQMEIVHQERVAIPYGMLAPVIVQNDLQFMDAGGSYAGEAFIIGSGSLEFAYELPGVPGAAYEQLHIRHATQPNLMFDIYNHESGLWETLEPEMETITYTAPNRYVSEGRIRMRVVTRETNVSFRYPDIALEGGMRP